MKEENNVLEKCFMNKYKVIMICISCIVAYFILNFITKGDNIRVYLIFRIYYISLSLSLFILCEQIRKFNKQYIMKVIWLMFSFMIVISILGFILNIYVKYIDLSSEFILLFEIVISYILSEYCFRNKELKKLTYIIFVLTFIIALMFYYFETLFTMIKIILFIIELPLLIKIFINSIELHISQENEWNIIKCYMILTMCISIIHIRGFFVNITQFSIILIEIIHLINFTIMWNVILVNLVREPYRESINSLNNEFKQLNRLNKQTLTKNKELEQEINALKNKEYLYSTFFRYMPHPIIILNIENDRILFVNKQFLKFANICTAREIINDKINKYIEFLPDDMENENYNAIFHLADEKKFIQVKLLLKNSQKLISINDNTEKVQKEEIKKEVERKKIEDSIRTQFLSSISHDLKTPINIIYSASQVEKIYIENGDLEALKKYNAISKQNCLSLIKLTNNLIDNSQIKSNYLAPRLKRSNIVEIIEDNVMSLIEYAKWNKVQLIFDTNTEECYLDIDQEFMKRIILNLVSNAVRFAANNGRICVTIQDTNNIVEISVKDNGIGMNKEFIDKAFNIYATEEKNKQNLKEGSGIGLFIVKELVELQGGTVRIESKLNIGTNIIMQFKKENNYD